MHRLSAGLAATILPAVLVLQLGGQTVGDWRICPEKVNIQVGDDRVLQLLDDSAQELHGAQWSIDNSSLAEIREEDGRAVVHATAPGNLTVSALLHGQTRILPIRIWPADEPLAPGITAWGTHEIGRDAGDIPAVPTPDGPNLFMLEQTRAGETYLRGVREDGIQVWAWLMPERTHDVQLVCGDWMGGALISADRADSFTLYTVGADGRMRWRRKLAGVRKAHAYNLQHLVHVLRQSADGTVTKVTGIDEQTGEEKFDLTIPASQEQFSNLERDGKSFRCSALSKTSAVPTVASRLFVNIDGFAYVAFSEYEGTLASEGCKPGAPLEPRGVSLVHRERVTLWQIHPDGTYRPTVVDETQGSGSLSDPLNTVYPTGAIIPDGLGGVLLSIRRSHDLPAAGVHRPLEELVYRVKQDGRLVYRFQLPAYEGELKDEMVLGENDLGFATRGGSLIAFDSRMGKEAWRWTSPQTIEVLAALADGSCLVETSTAVVQVANSTTAKVVFKGHAMIDWQGHLYRKP